MRRDRPRLFTRLAVENLSRRPLRTGLLTTAVALCVGSVFAALTLGRAVGESMALGFDRMGADLLIVPSGTLVNLTPALLTVEPTPHTLDLSLAEELGRLPGVERVAPQQYLKISVTEQGHLRDL